MFEIRPYRPQDWSDVCGVRDRACLDELLRYADLAAFVPLAHAPAEIERLQSAELWVAWDGRSVLGFVAISGDRIEALHVDPDVDHPAIGRRLLRAALRQIPGTPRALVRKANDALLELFRSEGFVVAEETTDASGAAGPWLRLLWLAPSPTASPPSEVPV